jgi:hypothetical protein
MQTEMRSRDDWKAQSPRKMGLALLFVFAVFLLGAWQLADAFLTGGIDWPGRGPDHFKWNEHPGWFVGAVIGWCIIESILAFCLIRGSKRFLWLLRHVESQQD